MKCKGSKLVAVVLIALVVAGGAGYWLLSPRTPSEIVNHTAQRTSLSTTSEESSLLTSSEETQHTSTLATTVAVEATLWLNVSATKPFGYWISLLKSTGSQPYVELGWQLQALPDATNATAIAKITYLALNATTPEVKEAFELMMKGGIPDLRDFTYSVPNYNTELEVLYWLAQKNEFKRDDTLALAIAMVNGFWVTMGDQQLREAVRKDTSDLLVFFRETDEMQNARGYYQLEDYPLEAKVVLVWGSDNSLRHGPHALFYGANTPKPYGNHIRIDLKGYSWDTTSVSTLRQMQAVADRNHWINPDVNKSVANLEYFFYFTNGIGQSEHWDYTDGKSTITVNGEASLNAGIHNVDWLFQYFLEHGKGIGQCGEEAALVEAIGASWGISIGILFRETALPDGNTRHTYVDYYDPHSKTWKAYEKQLNMDMDWIPQSSPSYLLIHKPPANLEHYIRDWSEDSFWVSNISYVIRNTTLEDIREMFLNGVPTSQMKQWLLYS